MLLIALLCSMLASAAAGTTTTATSTAPRSLRLLVDLINEVVTCSVSFDHDFGSGVPLLNGRARVHVYSGVELLPYTEISQGRQITLMLKSPRGFRILQKIDLEDLDLDGCSLRLRYNVDNTTESMTVGPSFVWLESCDRVAYTNGTIPRNFGQVLPLLSQALHNKATDYLTFNDSQENLDLKDLRKVFGFMMYRSVRGPVIC